MEEEGIDLNCDYEDLKDEDYWKARNILVTNHSNFKNIPTTFYSFLIKFSHSGNYKSRRLKNIGYIFYDNKILISDFVYEINFCFFNLKLGVIIEGKYSGFRRIHIALRLRSGH